MVIGLEKMINHFINGKEYSPGLVINIVEFKYYDNNDIEVSFTIDNVGDVPYSLFVIGVNLEHEILGLTKYLSFKPEAILVNYLYNGEKISIFSLNTSDVPADKIFYLSKSFKSSLLSKLAGIDEVVYDGKDTLHGYRIKGKFLPKINADLDPEDYSIGVNFHFKVSAVVADANNYFMTKIEARKTVLGTNLGNITVRGQGGNGYGDIFEVVNAVLNQWGKNFSFEDSSYEPPFYMDNSFELFVFLL
jgi:hypothetical protein